MSHTRQYSGKKPLQSFRSQLPPVRTVVVKAGSRILTSDKNLLRTARIRHLVDDIASLSRAGLRVLFVSSGAIAHGMLALDRNRRPKSIPLSQACASIGQIRLMHMYESLFGRRGITIGQVLLTWDDLRHKQRYLNLRNTLFKLLDCRALPIINENDSVGVDEIRFGDNDSLGAQIAMLVGADLYVILTDINGLYDANPTQRPDARHIPLVERVTPEIRRLATSRGNALGVGGMTTKLEAAAMVNRSGIATLVADGYHGRLMDALTSDTAGTLFLPAASRMPARRRWIAFAGKSQGALTVDDGARKALINQGRSLLPAGVKAVSGSFTVGSTIDIVDQQRRLFARGISNYSSAEAHRIAGLKSREIAEVLGEKSFDEIVHRDNMVLMNS